MDTNVHPFVDDWLKNKQIYPTSLHEKIYKEGISGIMYDVKYGGTKPKDYDQFYEQILWEEIYRNGNPHCLNQLCVNSMALPPIIKFGSPYLQDLVLKDVIQGRKCCCLAITEPGHGSDVNGIQTSAQREGDFFIVNGIKKFITGGLMADFFTTLVRTNRGLTVLVIPNHLPGIQVRRMDTTFDSVLGTTFIEFDDVRVPVQNIIGTEDEGLKIILVNFNHERWLIGVQALACARTCYRESIQEALTRRTFGKKLIEHQIIRIKLAEMASKIESLQTFVEFITYQFKMGIPDDRLGSFCALMKTQAGQVLEYCSREAVQIFGGGGLVKEGRGKIVERISRDPPEKTIPGGAESVLLDLAIRQSVRGRVKL
jgi:alkylation response protein AidB-like acyl-CoA dehydrogenase